MLEFCQSPFSQHRGRLVPRERAEWLLPAGVTQQLHRHPVAIHEAFYTGHEMKGNIQMRLTPKTWCQVHVSL